MLRAIRLFSLLLLGTGSSLYSRQADAQALNPTGFEEWDSTNQVLFFVNGHLGSPIRAYTDYNQRGADIDVFRDFPGAQAAYVDSVIAGPADATLIAVTLDFGNRNIRDVILTYDSSGQLLKTWDPAPQYIEAIAYSKDDDAVFVLGGRDLPPGPSPPTDPLLIEYSRAGRVLRAMAPATVRRAREYSFKS